MPWMSIRCGKNKLHRNRNQATLDQRQVQFQTSYFSKALNVLLEAAFHLLPELAYGHPRWITVVKCLFLRCLLLGRYLRDDPAPLW